MKTEGFLKALSTLSEAEGSSKVTYFAKLDKFPRLRLPAAGRLGTKRDVASYPDKQKYLL